jgi:hypothetical protein
MSTPLNKKKEKMKLKIFYHIVNLNPPLWREIADEQFGQIFDSGLIDHCELHANLHYDYDAYNELKERWQHPNIIWHNSPGVPSDIEHPTWILMQQTALATDEEFYCLYLHLKGVTHFGKIDEHNCHDWRKYLDWFNIVNWREMVAKLDEGIWDTVGCNRQSSSIVNKHGKLISCYAGNIFWYTASFLRTCLPALKWPSEANNQTQIPNGPGQFKDDVEVFAGWHDDRGYSFFHAHRHHYIQDCPEHLYINFFDQNKSNTTPNINC